MAMAGNLLVWGDNLLALRELLADQGWTVA